MKMLKPTLPVLQPRIGYATGDEKAFDRQRVDSVPWRRWYRTARWRRISMAVFLRDAYRCTMCGHTENDPVADHKMAHRGDPKLLWNIDTVQTLCVSCHNGKKQRQEHANLLRE